jgi:hypothetical protein
MADPGALLNPRRSMPAFARRVAGDTPSMPFEGSRPEEANYHQLKVFIANCITGSDHWNPLEKAV